MVKMLTLVFPRHPEEFEADGWEVKENADGYSLWNSKENYHVPTLDWAKVFEQIGYLHEYHLPKNEKLESLIIEKVKEFHENHVLTQLPPEPKKYDDIKKLLRSPLGTVLATDNLKKRCIEYSEIVRQTGTGGPLAKRKSELKTEIMGEVMTSKKDDWSSPADKVIILDPDGGEVLASFAKNKAGNLTFGAKKAI